LVVFVVVVVVVVVAVAIMVVVLFVVVVVAIVIVDNNNREFQGITHYCLCSLGSDAVRWGSCNFRLSSGFVSLTGSCTTYLRD
jgi:hypothetical protein